MNTPDKFYLDPFSKIPVANYLHVLVYLALNLQNRLLLSHESAFQHFEFFDSCLQIDIPNTTEETLLAFLEYLYTDHSPIEESDSVALMVLADEYGQKRLVNLCELYITKEIDRSVTKRIERAEIDVIGLLLTAQVCGPVSIYTPVN